VKNKATAYVVLHPETIVINFIFQRARACNFVFGSIAPSMELALPNGDRASPVTGEQ
jgi:hypothetical protein